MRIAYEISSFIGAADEQRSPTTIAVLKDRMQSSVSCPDS
jgi:hypothetical protein